MIGPGWPCGGRGGKGANVYVEATYNCLDLNGIQPFVKGENGTYGGKDVPGDNGPDKIIRVPVGSVVWRLSISELDGETDRIEKICLADLAEDKQRILVALGGSGGRGNHPQRPHDSDRGTEGDSVRLEIELKTLADVGFVGFPNAGKSTLLNAISRATPKIAPYPFTTLRPYCGEVAFADGVKLTVADLPGLVEGAHLNCGLGFQFLRHAERTAVLVFVLDCSPDADGERLGDADPVLALKTLRDEVTKYSPAMAEKPWIIAANKCDKQVVDTLSRVDDVFKSVKKEDIPIFAMSAKFGDGIPRFLTGLRWLVEKTRAEAKIIPLREPPVEFVKKKIQPNYHTKKKYYDSDEDEDFNLKDESTNDLYQQNTLVNKVPKWMTKGEGREIDIHQFAMNSSTMKQKDSQNKQKKIHSPFIVKLK